MIGINIQFLDHGLSFKTLKLNMGLDTTVPYDLTQQPNTSGISYLRWSGLCVDICSQLQSLDLTLSFIMEQTISNCTRKHEINAEKQERPCHARLQYLLHLLKQAHLLVFKLDQLGAVDCKEKVISASDKTDKYESSVGNAKSEFP
jgi:hypothetical protein